VKRIDHSDILKFLIFFKIFCKEVMALSYLGSRYNQYIPPGKVITFLETPSAFKDAHIHKDWLP